MYYQRISIQRTSMAAFMNGHVVSIPDDVVADIETILDLIAEDRPTINAERRLKSFLKDYKEQSKEE